MATKTFCDGCDKVISGEKRLRVEIKIDRSAGQPSSSNYDLCSDCIDKLDPEHWERPPKPARY